jgi:hypothetical protein
MDDRQFDQLVRALSEITGRRQALTSLAGGVVSALAALGLLEAEAKQGKRRKRRDRSASQQDRLGQSASDGQITPAAEPGECPAKVCHCPPGNIRNCQSTGDGLGHRDHLLDCCCGDLDCDCGLADRCCKPETTTCANDRQCCEDLNCTGSNRQCGIVTGDVAGICCLSGQVCFQDACCTPTSREAACDGRCGSVDDGCGGVIDCGPCAP